MKIDRHWPKPRNFIHRMAARIVARMFLDGEDHTWQMFGKKDGIVDTDEMASVGVPFTSIAQAVLREAGYRVNEYQLMTPKQRARSAAKFREAHPDY